MSDPQVRGPAEAGTMELTAKTNASARVILESMAILLVCKPELASAHETGEMPRLFPRLAFARRTSSCVARDVRFTSGELAAHQCVARRASRHRGVKADVRRFAISPSGAVYARPRLKTTCQTEDQCGCDFIPLLQAALDAERRQAMSFSISTLLTRNLHDVFGGNDPTRRRAAIDEISPKIMRSYEEKKITSPSRGFEI
jgi:hypothetical protein